MQKHSATRLSAKRWLALLGCASLVTLAACARDRNQDSYGRDVFNQDTERLRAVAALYYGKLTTGGPQPKDLGPIALNLVPDSKIDNLNQQRAILSGYLVFLGNTAVKLVFKESYFDDENGKLKSVATFVDASGQNQELQLTATLEKDTLRGSIGIGGYDQNKGFFVMNKAVGSTSTEELFAKAPRAATPVESIVKDFNGRARLSFENFEEAVKVSLRNDFLSPEERFADLFSPRRRVQVTLQSESLGSDRVSVPVELWDESAQSLMAPPGSRGGASSTYVLSCHPETETPQLRCTFSRSDRVLAELTLDLP